jgi:hypothetical protein
MVLLSHILPIIPYKPVTIIFGLKQTILNSGKGKTKCPTFFKLKKACR